MKVLLVLHGDFSVLKWFKVTSFSKYRPEMKYKRNCCIHHLASFPPLPDLSMAAGVLCHNLLELGAYNDLNTWIQSKAGRGHSEEKYERNCCITLLPSPHCHTYSVLCLLPLTQKISPLLLETLATIC